MWPVNLVMICFIRPLPQNVIIDTGKDYRTLVDMSIKDNEDMYNYI